MKRTHILLTLALAAGAGLGWLASSVRQPAAIAGENPAKANTNSVSTRLADEPMSEAEAGVRKAVEAFVTAANARDAKAAANLWTENGEFTDIDGTVIIGREELLKMYTDVFTNSPKGKIEVEIESVRLLGKSLASTEGIIRFIPADGQEAEVTKFSTLQAREGDHWLTASAHEWVPDETELLKLSDLEWLIGDWEAKRDDRVAQTTYSWGDEKAFIECRFKVTDKGKVVASGIEILAKDPTTGQIRAWLFDRSGTLSEAAWSNDGKRWLVEHAGTTPDGSEVYALNAMVPIGKDAFTWVSVDRSIAGQPLPNVAPVKVTRVKK